MLTLLKALDPVVYEWWVHGRNRTPHFAQGIIDANLSEHWFALQGWIPFGDRYGSFDDSGVPHIHVDKSLTAFEVVEAIVSEARTGNLMQHGVNFRVGFIYQQTRLDQQFGEEDTKVFANWQTSAFGRGKQYASVIADLYVQGVLSFVPGGNVLQIAGDVLDKKVDLGTLLAELPYVAHFGGMAVGAVVVKYGDDVLSVPRSAMTKFLQMTEEAQARIVRTINESATAKEAVKIFRRLVGDVVPVALKPAVVKQTLANGVERLVSSSAKILPENIMGGTGTTAAARELTRPDDAGHIFARLLGGQGGATSDNIFAQLPAINRGAFKEFEKSILHFLKTCSSQTALP